MCIRDRVRPHNSLYDDVVARSCAYPKMRILRQLRRNGFKGDFHGISPVRLYKALLSDPRIETLIKGGEIEVMKHFLFKMCIRYSASTFSASFRELYFA